ncbi:phage GP46 family protein [Variovorax atrisoli]|uniref:phage GP46 family protein n=1 Tax=Variovorax atrisoli TaxID=3394203 RepID=UPI003399C3D5
MDAWINPVTRDYEPTTTPVGDLVRDPANGLANAAYLRLVTPLGKWFGDTTVGSRLHELEREKDTARVERLALQYSRSALQPLLNDGRARSIDISTVREKDASAGGRLLLAIEIVDAIGVRRTFQFPVRVA